jgi:hypothetical protein
MSDEIDVFGKLGSAEIPDEYKPKAQKKSKGSNFSSPVDESNPAKAAKATASKMMAGKFKRFTMTIPPRQEEYIKAVAAKEGMSTLAFMRWLVDQGLGAYESGKKPKIQGRIVRGEAEMDHWSSNVE